LGRYAKDEDTFQRQEKIQGDWLRKDKALSSEHFAYDAQQIEEGEASPARLYPCFQG